jgi:hypothetical protein
MPTTKELAKLNSLHYLASSGSKKKARKKALKMGYTDESLSRGVAHWKHSDGHSVISVKGTDPTNIKDLASDVKLALGNLKGDTQLKARKHEIKKIYRENPGEKHLTGHSLGGSIASKLLATSKGIRDNTTSAHLYNTGSTKAFAKELNDDMTPDIKKELKEKVTQHRVKSDIISNAGTTVGKTIKYEGEGDAHSLDNF